MGASPRITLAFLSGRSLEDLRNRIGLANAYYAGNHGMQIRGPGLTSSDGLAVSCRAELVDALTFLGRCTKRLRGVFIEDKRMAVTVHWRMADPGEGVALRELMEIIVRHHPRLRVFEGEACWELRARASWNKGDALMQMLSHLHLSSADTIYVGDHLDDEDSFSRLLGGMTFCVGNAAVSKAQFVVASSPDVVRLLSRIDQAVNELPFDALDPCKNKATGT
ncbi:MAG: trehalose-phosphatase [Chthoniobacter sp.]|uniref:trehalose-phosphatase n=1 Tax=Chthoniobacter sp. TaxID=2510640 RepID=UPI0032A21707